MLPSSLFRTISQGKALQKSEMCLFNIASGCGMQNTIAKSFFLILAKVSGSSGNLKQLSTVNQ